MDLYAIRRNVLAGLYSDPLLRRYLVLKGGNAIELVHGILARGSVDLDFSISGDFPSPAEIAERIQESLTAHFAPLGVRVFDYSFQIVPPPRDDDPDSWWGGYRASFKLIPVAMSDRAQRSLQGMQREALVVDRRQGRTFRLDISKHEFCDLKVEALIEGVPVYAYIEEVIVLEKLRAICQQLPQYDSPPSPRQVARRARDFFDICTVIGERALDMTLPENLELCIKVFSAKRVPVELLGAIPESREFHRPDWEAVTAEVAGELRPFDFYFEEVAVLARNMLDAIERQSEAPQNPFG